MFKVFSKFLANFKILQYWHDKMTFHSVETDLFSTIERLKDGRVRRDKYRFFMEQRFSSSSDARKKERISVYGEFLTSSEVESRHKSVMHDIQRDNEAYELVASRYNSMKNRIEQYEARRGLGFIHSN